MGKLRFLLGAATGAAAALLFAPRSGKETRHLLGEKIEDVAEAAPEPIRSAAEPIIDAAEGAYAKVTNKPQDPKPETDDIKAKIAEARDALAEQITRNHVATTTVEAAVEDIPEDTASDLFGDDDFVNELVTEAEELVEGEASPEKESQETPSSDWYK